MRDGKITEREIQEHLAKEMEARLIEVMMGGLRRRSSQTALRLHGRTIEIVELDDDGKVIEPLRCNCGPVVHWRSDCPFAYGMT